VKAFRKKCENQFKKIELINKMKKKIGRIVKKNKEQDKKKGKQKERKNIS
jgi:hypothetical protein